jgi:hypothetical protein
MRERWQLPLSGAAEMQYIPSSHYVKHVWQKLLLDFGAKAAMVDFGRIA